MTQIRSRVNGLIIKIPSDARGVIHRFAIGGGGNELVFEPIKKSDYAKSLKADDKPIAMGEPDRGSEEDPAVDGEMESVQLTINVADDDETPPAPAPREGRASKAPPATQAELDALI